MQCNAYAWPTAFLRAKPFSNGQLSATDYANIGYPIGTPDKNLAIGARSVDSIIDSYFGGTIDDVRIYNKALH